MSALADLAGKVLGLSKTLVLIDERFKRQEEDMRVLRAECSALRNDVSGLATRVAVLEEARKTTAAEARAAVAEAVAELKVRYTEAVADLRVKAAQDEAERRSASRTLPPASESQAG